MCLSAILAIGGAAFSAIGAYGQAQAQKAQAEYSAQVARNNAIIAEQNAADVVQRGQVAADLQRQRLNQTVGAARNAIASNGLLLDDEGGTTSALLLDDVRTAGMFDIMTLKANVEREERRALIQGMNFQAEAGLFDLQASSINPNLAAVSSLFGSGQSIMNAFPGGPTFPGMGGPTRPQPRPNDLI